MSLCGALVQRARNVAMPFTALLFAACGPARGTPDADTAAAAPVAAVEASVLLQLERGPCRGTCPEYTVALRDNGTVAYTGMKHVSVAGERSGMVDAAALRQVHEALLAAGVASADSVYGIDAPGCGQYIPDTPVTVLAVRVNGAMKRIQYEVGCSGAPGYLAEFATRIDSLAATDQWVRRPEGTP